MSKKTVAIAAYKKLSATKSFPTTGRKDIVKHLAGVVGISEACASTYLSNIKTGRWSTETTAVVKKVKKVSTAKANPKVDVGLTIDDVTRMTGKELVAVFNAKADKPVNKFRDHATAVRRTLTVYGLA